MTKRQRQLRADLHVSLQQRDEVERQRLRAIVEEHERSNPRETMLALAWTIHQLRGNFERLSRAIGPALADKGRIGLELYGPHKADHVRRLTSGA